MSYTPKQDSDVDSLHWHALNYRTAGLASAQGAWVALEAFFDTQIQAAYQAGRASRDSEVETLKLEEAFLQRAVTRRDEFCKLLEESLEQARLEAEGVDAIRANALRYQWLRMRIEVKKMQAASGSRRDAIDVKVGCAFLDSDLPHTVPASYPIEQAKKLDQAIDAAHKIGGSHG